MKNKGILVINKPKDWTSFDVVNKVRHIAKIKKVGHLGTLDPMATGVLLITLGKATKLFDIMQEKIKSYIAKFEFGYSTDTLDSTGKIIENTETIPSLQDIAKIIPTFIGEIAQIPPKFSAKNIEGKRAYDLARKNVDFDLKPNKVTIYDIKIIDYTDHILTIKIDCGSGTYIRSIGRDMADKLDSLATMIELTRTQVGRFTIDQSVTIQDLTAKNIDDFIWKIDDCLDYKVFDCTEADRLRLLNGQTIRTDLNDGMYKLNDEQDTIVIINVSNFKAKMSTFLG